jgi:predicted MPP superfamily phosphohydrolase
MHRGSAPPPHPTPHPESTSVTRRSFLGYAAAAAGLGLATYSGTHARHEFEITHRTLPIHNLPDAFQGFRIVQMSDIHLEEYTEAFFLERMVAQVNALAPDLVLITGDFISDGPRPPSVAWRAAGLGAEILSTLKAPQRFGVLGNHDVSVGAEHVIAPLEAHGTPILVDSYTPLERGRDVLWLCGANDAATRTPDLDFAIPANPRAPVLFMCHEPDYVDKVVHHPRFPLIDLMLSGHSHGGQIRLPFIGPLILPPMGQKYVEGLFHFGHMQLYVNRGIGTVGLPFRLNCPAELTRITLVRA